jgi:alpha-galactosidase
MTPAPSPRLHGLRAAGVQLLLLERSDGLPEIVHWGADLGEAVLGDATDLLLATGAPVPNSALDDPWPLTVLPGEPDGWSGRPGLAAHRGGTAVVPRWRAAVLRPGPGVLRLEATDPAAGVALLTELRLDDHGVLAVHHTLTNTGPDVLDVHGLLAVVPLPPQSAETLDLTGRWCRERSPQRLPLVHGGRVRESRRGRTGHDATLLLVAGTEGFDFADGEVHACHVAWSGDHVHLVDRLPEGAGRHAGVLAGGELIRPGEVRLGEGEAYTAPDVLFAWAADGLDGLTARFHDHVRARAAHPRTPRPVTLNSWEAVYFDHDHARIAELVDTAARLGVERVVLDDGWFLGRRDDTAGLGDWVIDPTVWPDGLTPFTERVRSHGMQVGIWVEPEMVNVDSDVVRAHPDWLLAPGAGPDGSVGGTRPWRHQQLLDLTRPEAFDHVLGQLDALVADARPDYLKWDHNRDLHEAVAADGSAGVHRQTSAAYRLMDELQVRHPGLEIESCSSGGARVDLGVLARTQRVWASDCNDPLERQAIQRWTGLLLPPELVGTHVGPTHSHTTGRVTDLDLRCLTALFGHAGIEWDVSSCTEEELARLTGWIALHKRLRPLLHGGRTVRGEERDGAWLHGVVAPARDHAVYAWVRLVSGADAVPGLVRLPGLDPEARYRVGAVDVTGGDEPRLSGTAAVQPPWCGVGGVELPGAVLGRHGLAMPVLDPGAGVLVEVTSVG